MSWVEKQFFNFHITFFDCSQICYMLRQDIWCLADALDCLSFQDNSIKHETLFSLKHKSHCIQTMILCSFYSFFKELWMKNNNSTDLLVFVILPIWCKDLKIQRSKFCCNIYSMVFSKS